MTARLRYPILTALLFLALLAVVPRQTQAQPWRPDEDSMSGPEDDLNLLLPSRFLPSIREDRLLFARVSRCRAAYRRAVNRGEYVRALAAADSLIRAVERHPVRGVHFTRCYENRALMLKALQRDSAACMAYDRAVRVRDSVMRLEQSQTLRELQASCELDRLALDKALLTANHHKKALTALSLLLLATVTVVGVIYAGNRRTKRLHEELLREMNRARRSEEKKIAFINSMCHEVRTPLNSIAGFSELLCTEEVDAEAHAQYCDIIQQSRRQLRYLFDDMLEVAYLENLSEPLPHGYLNLCAACRAQLRIMKVCHSRQGVLYTEQIPTEEIGINTNAKYLDILLAALLGNACKFTAQGTIRLACDREGDDQVTISVTDTGCGIPPEQSEYVFERFTKLDPFSQGNGLGLYLCRLIVGQLGGDIRIDTQYTGGTRIVVTLPRKPATTDATP